MSQNCTNGGKWQHFSICVAYYYTLYRPSVYINHENNNINRLILLYLTYSCFPLHLTDFFLLLVKVCNKCTYVLILIWNWTLFHILFTHNLILGTIFYWIERPGLAVHWRLHCTILLCTGHIHLPCPATESRTLVLQWFDESFIAAHLEKQ